MARHATEVTSSKESAAGRRGTARKVVAALGIVLSAQALFALCLVSAGT